MKGPAGVMGLVLAETAGGGAIFLFATPLWGEVKRGFFTLSAVILCVLSACATASVAASAIPGDSAGPWAVRILAGLTAALAVSFACSLLRLGALARTFGFVSIPAAVASLAVLSATADASSRIAFLHRGAGAAFMGIVLDGLLLGHWYLTDRGLSRRPINRFADIMIAAVIIESVSVATSGFGPVKGSPGFNPLLTSAGLAQWVALGMVGVTALVAVMIRLSLRGKRATAVQAATGFFYLALVTAFAGELATKVGFLTG